MTYFFLLDLLSSPNVPQCLSLKFFKPLFCLTFIFFIHCFLTFKDERKTFIYCWIFCAHSSIRSFVSFSIVEDDGAQLHNFVERRGAFKFFWGTWTRSFFAHFQTMKTSCPALPPPWLGQISKPLRTLKKWWTFSDYWITSHFCGIKRNPLIAMTRLLDCVLVTFLISTFINENDAIQCYSGSQLQILECPSISCIKQSLGLDTVSWSFPRDSLPIHFTQPSKVESFIFLKSLRAKN